MALCKNICIRSSKGSLRPGVKAIEVGTGNRAGTGTGARTGTEIDSSLMMHEYLMEYMCYIALYGPLHCIRGHSGHKVRTLAAFYKGRGRGWYRRGRYLP